MLKILSRMVNITSEAIVGEDKQRKYTNKGDDD